MIQEYDPIESFSQNCVTDELIMSHFVHCTNVKFGAFCFVNDWVCSRVGVCLCMCVRVVGFLLCHQASHQLWKTSRAKSVPSGE